MFVPLTQNENRGLKAGMVKLSQNNNELQITVFFP